MEILRALALVLSGLVTGFFIFNFQQFLIQRKAVVKKGQLVDFNEEHGRVYLTIKVFRDGKNVEIKLPVPKKGSEKYSEKLLNKLSKRFDVVEFYEDGEYTYKSYVRYGFYAFVSSLIMVGLGFIYFY